MDEHGENSLVRLDVHEDVADVEIKMSLFARIVWQPSKKRPTSLSLAISNGCEAWTFEGTGEFLKSNSMLWDKSVSWLMEKILLRFEVVQPSVTYRFTEIGDSRRELSFDIEDKELNVSRTVRFPLVNAPDPVSVTSSLLDFLYNSNRDLKEFYTRKCQDYEEMTTQNEALEKQSMILTTRLTECERHLYKKFVAVLNSKKAKIRELKKENARLIELPEAKSIDKKDADTTSASSEDERSC